MADEQEHGGNNAKKSMNPASDEGSGQSSDQNQGDNLIKLLEHIEQVQGPRKREAPKFREDKDRSRGTGIQGGDGAGKCIRRNMLRETLHQTKYGRLLVSDFKHCQQTNSCLLCEERQMEWRNVPCGHSMWCNNCKNKALAMAKRLLPVPHLCIFCDNNVEDLEPIFHTSSTSKNAEEGCKQENKELNIHNTDTQGQGTEKDNVTRPANGDGGDNSSRGRRENVVLQARAPPPASDIYEYDIPITRKANKQAKKHRIKEFNKQKKRVKQAGAKGREEDEQEEDHEGNIGKG